MKATLKSSFRIICTMAILSSCIMPEDYLINTELQETEDYEVIYNGNTVWLEAKDSAISPWMGHRIKYKMKKVKGGYAPKRIVFYDSTLHLITSDKEPAIIINRYSLISQKRQTAIYLDKNKHLMEPEYMNFSKSKTRYLSDSKWITRFYDKDGHKRCGERGFKVYSSMDTVQLNYVDSISYVYVITDVYKIDCNGDTLK